jgi:hypothetical protein
MSLPFDSDTVFDAIVEQTNGVPTQAAYALAFDLVMEQGIDYPEAVQKIVNADLVAVGDKDRIDEAIAIAVNQGQTPGEDHKMFVIDQMLRTLAAGEYRGIVETYNTPAEADEPESDDDEDEGDDAEVDDDQDRPLPVEEDSVVVEVGVGIPAPAANRHWDCGEKATGLEILATATGITVTRF